MEYYNQLSIEDAVELSGISKSSFLKNYLDNNLLKKYQDDGNFYLKLDEFLQIFPDALIESGQNITDKDFQIESLTKELVFIKEQLCLIQKREEKQLLLLERLNSLLENSSISERLTTRTELSTNKIDLVIKKNKVILTKHQKNGETLLDTLLRLKPELRKFT